MKGYGYLPCSCQDKFTADLLAKDTANHLNLLVVCNK